MQQYFLLEWYFPPQFKKIFWINLVLSSIILNDFRPYWEIFFLHWVVARFVLVGRVVLVAIMVHIARLVLVARVVFVA
jgi:hypothetical protein